MNIGICALMLAKARHGCASGKIKYDSAGAARLTALWLDPAFIKACGHKPKELLNAPTQPAWLITCFSLARSGGSGIWQQYFERTGQWHAVTAVGIKPGSFMAFLNPAENEDSADDYKTQALLKSSQDRYRAIFEQAAVGICNISIDGRFKNINEKLCEVLGYSQEELKQLNIQQITHPQDAQVSQRELKKLHGSQKTVNYEKRYIRKDGTVIWVNLTASLISDFAGGQEYLVILKDVTERVQMQEALFKSEAKQNAMLANILDVISIIDTKGVFRYLSPNTAKWFGWSPEELLGTKALGIVHPEEAERVHSVFDNLVQQEANTVTEELRCRCRDGSYKLIELKAVNMQHDANIRGILMNFHDITERREREQDLIYLSYHDVLTGLYNRAFFTQERRRLDTKRQLPISVITGDINGLKLTNDMFGHAMGDKLLVCVANILKNCCRSEDIVERVGGDEFSVLLPQTDSATAQIISERILNACRNYQGDKQEMVFPSIAIGHATKTEPGQSMEGVLMDAEELMYKRKLAERKTYHNEVIASIKRTMFEKSQQTEEQAERMVELSKKLGQAAGLIAEQLEELELLASLHDIGKISIDSRILIKPGKLNDEEWAEMKKHPEIGYRIAQASPELAPIAEYILTHHENWDGRGYPQGISGEAIPLLSRIIAIVSAYEAMTSKRPYRAAMSHREAMAELRRCAGTQFDPVLTELFSQCMTGSVDLTKKHWQTQLVLEFEELDSLK